MSKRAAIYLRVSRSDQSSSLQRDETRELAKRRDWKIAATFCDEGISGSHSKRPGFRELLEAARLRRFDVLVVYRADRLFRSVREIVNVLAELDALGIGFVSVTEPFDSTTPSGKLLFHLVAAFAEFERGVMIERTKSGLEAARRRGRFGGRPRTELDLERAQELRKSGAPIGAVASELGVSESTLRRRLSKTGLKPTLAN